MTHSLATKPKTKQSPSKLPQKLNHPKRHITLPKGFTATGDTAGIKESGKPDLCLIASDVSASAAAVFTTNKVQGAPVIVGKNHVRNGIARAIICNSGNSNVATGERGIQDAKTMCKLVADGLHCKMTDVLPASTGVIGHPLPMDVMIEPLRNLTSGLKKGAEADHDAAQGMLTTDTVTKAAVQKVTINGKRATIAGITKGAAMIAPSMATTLGFITTDVAITPKALKAALQAATKASYNRISIDTDQSTSDTLYVLANGLAGNALIKEAKGKAYEAFVKALSSVAMRLAEQIIEDAEGGTKLFVVRVKGAVSEKDADRVGRAVAESPLVKAAVHGADPNWGRLAMAAGKSGAKLKPEKLMIKIGSTVVFKRGMPLALDKQQVKTVTKYMQGTRMAFTIDLGLGKANCNWMGCNLSQEYVHLNADYTT